MADPPLPVLAGRYRAIERLGAGGMGVVWRAEDGLLHREVAIKEVKLDPALPEAQRTEMRERTLREARAAARLGHPSIVTVHDVIVQDGRPWIVMDLVRGRSLAQVVRRDGPLPPQRVAAIGLAVLDALTLAHSRGIVHRDVKPANIMLAHDGEVLLTDFGIATLEGDVQLTSPDALVGSPGYMAPERLRGTGDGPAADLWSLGATLYTAVEGRGPFQRGVPVATLGAVLTEQTPLPARAGGLAPVLLAVLAKDPRNRPGEAALRVALQRVVQGLPAGPLSPQETAREAAPPRLHRRTGWLAGAAAVVVAGVAVVVLVTSSGESAVTVPPVADAAPGRFAAAPEPCTLLTEAQSRTVVPGATSPTDMPAKQDNEASCSWDGPSDVRRLRVSVAHHASVQGKAAPDVAHEFFAAERTKTKADVGTGPFGSVGPLRNVGRVGKEAFGYDLRALDRVSALIRFRVGNLLVQVNVSKKGKRVDTGLRRHALRVARLIAEELNNRD
ncbi:serine/threonine-protein kinase [Streptosporangium sp. NBC_01756]|uniref:serine/threonine-protein kinase n=1 Tax=Streptosporangium sp. NBC_01756 TaxID=2975950 RepID=UPI002DDB7835|nr:serine/threonine-protein kinase [Streptosporangium sp. NBC_01756]WSC83972.1 serine/threonine protein kinase [Streptosporangium sp. NBC_01756]